MLIIGHRGAMGYEPENTLCSFRKALSLGVDMIEFDVHRCKTGELVIMHNFSVGKKTDGSGLIRSMTFAEIRSLDAGKGEKIPTLEEALECINRSVQVNIELKGPGTGKSVARCIEQYVSKKSWAYEDFLVSSFFRRELIKFRRHNHTVRIGLLIRRKYIGFLRFAKKLNAFSVHPKLKIVDKKLIRKIHAKEMKAYVYTVNDPDDIMRMARFNVDGIFTNYPDQARDILKNIN